jgi:hypothetical protein
MEINRLGRNKIEVKEGEKTVTIEAARIGRNILVTISDAERTVDLALRRVESEKFIRTLRRFGISDVRRVVSYVAAMAEVKMIDAPRAIFMEKLEDAELISGAILSVTYNVYFHTAEGWRVYVYPEGGGTVKEAWNVAAPQWRTDRVFIHYNTPEASYDDVFALPDLAREVKEVVKQYVVLPREEYYDVAVAWAVLTYLRWASPYSELLVIRKPGFGQGGSTLLKTLRLLSARPLRTVVNTSPAAFYRIVDFTVPTIALDEIREDEADDERLAELKLLAESAFDKENVVLRVEDGEEVTAFSTFANVAVVDSTDKFTTYSSERRAWTVVIRSSSPQKNYDMDEILKATERLRERLYSAGIALPAAFDELWRRNAAVQGTGALQGLIEALKSKELDASIFESALAAVSQQLAYARETAVLTDPKRAVANIIEKIIEDAKRELEMAANSNNPADILTIATPADQDYRCGIIYLEKLMREVRRRAMEVAQIDTRKLDNVYYTSSEVRYWFRINKDLEMYIKPTKIKAILAELGVNIELDEGRHYVVRVCRETA